MAQFFAMGKYAAFVWPAYAISAAGLIAAVALTLRAYAHAKRRLQSIGQSDR